MRADPGCLPYLLLLNIVTRNGSHVDLRIWQNRWAAMRTFSHGSEVYRQREGCYVTVYPSEDGDVEGVALVQALLSGGMSHTLRDAGQFAHICIVGDAHDVCTGVIKNTGAGFKTQIAPLLQFGAHCKHPRGWPRGKLIEERMHIEHVGSNGDGVSYLHDLFPLLYDKSGQPRGT
jgi:hypothetical protein